MTLTIFGAQAIALGTYKAIKCLYPQQNIECFIVTKIGDNASALEDCPVRELASYAASLLEEEKKDVVVLIATPENVMADIETSLDEHGLTNHTRMSSLRWAELMSYYYANQKTFMPLSSRPVGYNKADIQMFMAKFYKDQALKSDYKVPGYITPIQVGAALTEERVSNIIDCDGDNISEKNVNYSELTALYWVWKNVLCKPEGVNKDYYGLVHYRRILDLTEDDLIRLKDNDIDIVLPYPMPYAPDIHAHHERWIKDADWNALLTAMKELQPEYADKLPEIFNQEFLYNYNIMLAKPEVLKEYCEWLFPILERTEELSIPKGCDRRDRYIGYMGENLTTLYFMINKDKLNIAHAGCRFLT